MTKPTNRPTVTIPVELTEEFPPDAISAIGSLHDVNKFVDDSLIFQSGNILTPKIIAELQKPGNPLAVTTNNGRIVIASNSGSYTTIDNRYPENDGGYTKKNQILYSNTSDLLRDFAINNDLTALPRANSSRFVEVARADGYRSIRIAGVPGNPALMQLPSGTRFTSIVMNMAVIVPRGGDFVFAFDVANNNYSYFRIADVVDSRTPTAPARQNVIVKGVSSSSATLANIGNDQLAVPIRDSKLPDTLNGGLYFVRYELSFTINPSTEIPRARVTVSRFPIEQVTTAFDSSNGFINSLKPDHPNYLGFAQSFGTVFTNDAEGEMYFGSYSAFPSEILFYQVQVGSAFNVIR